MLQSFHGSFDETGLRALRQEDGGSRVLQQASVNAGFVHFWAVLDSQEALKVQKAVLLGLRATALELLFREAKSVGLLHSPPLALPPSVP